jgi:hypothetical protein
MLSAPIRQATADEGADASAQEFRRVWVLTDQGGIASEGGLSTSGPGGVIPYEVRCVAGELLSVQRKLTSAGTYGLAAWTVRISASLASEYGAVMLRAAMEKLCKTP